MMPGRRPAYFAWFVLPSVFLAVALAASLASLFQYSFREYIPGSIQVGGFTLGNFGRMGSWVYLHVFIDSLLLSACTAIANLVLGYPLAYALVRSRSSLLKSTILITTIVPMFTGDIVRTYSWLVVLGKNGFINGTLKAAGSDRYAAGPALHAAGRDHCTGPVFAAGDGDHPCRGDQPH